MKVTAILKGKSDNYGRVPVVIRIANGTERRFKVMEPPIRITPKQFKNGRVIDHPDKDLFNTRIKDAIIKAEKAGGFVKNESELLKDFIEETLKEYKNSRAKEGLRHSKSKFEYFLSFAGNIPLSSIDTRLLNKYKEHLIKNGVTGNNLWSYFKYTRALIKKATKSDLITADPFRSFEMPQYKDPAKQFLLKPEVQKLEKLKKLPPELDFCRLWFLIGCYTGLRYGDQHNFDKKRDIKGNRLTVYTSKRGEIVSLPLEGKIKELLEAVDYEPMHYSNTHYNRYLAQVGELAGIGKLNAHLARHTFGTMLAEAGVSQEVAAKLLGHSSLKSTAIYYKITSSRIDDELRKLF